MYNHEVRDWCGVLALHEAERRQELEPITMKKILTILIAKRGCGSSHLVLKSTDNSDILHRDRSKVRVATEN